MGAAPTPPASDPSVATGTATGELLATGQEQLVTSGGRREVLAEVSRMAGGTSPVGPGASGPPDMVHDGGAGGQWQGQRVTPAVTRSWAKRDGLWPGMFALMATQEDIARSFADLSPPDVVERELHRSWFAIWKRRRRTFRHTPAHIATPGRRRRANN